MSWFHNLAETYDRVSDIAGKPVETPYKNKKGETEHRINILLPPNHMSAKTDICVTVDGSGHFRGASESEETIVIPCTEDSSTRAGKVKYPHPLHDRLGYFSSDEGKRGKYLTQLAGWKSLNPKTEAVYKYIENNTLMNDLAACGIKTDDPKLFIRFAVNIPGDSVPNLWEDSSIVLAWQNACVQSQSGTESLCYITGKTDSPRTKHPKGINTSANGAKLISCNDETNYTYKGRFLKPEQANSIGADASHRAHAMLKFLIGTQGYKCDTQAIVAWAVDDGKSAVNPLTDTLGLYGEDHEEEDESITAQGEIAFDYAKNLRGAITGKGKYGIGLKDYARQIAVIATDAATTGRMAVTFYKDMRENEYIDRIVNWHESCCWIFYGEGKSYISAPGTDRIIAAVYGEPNGESYDKIKKQARNRMLHCILDGERIDRSWISAAVSRVSNPFSYNKKDGGWDKYKWNNAVNVCCAIARKYFKDKKEEFSLELEKTRTDRDYLYGRLLALADRIESHARYLQSGRDDTDKRPTNAVRYMSMFSAKPFRTWVLIYRQLTPYIQRLNGGEWYQRQIDEIMALFREGEYESDKSLDARYLMGYSLQRRDLNVKNSGEETENVKQED